MSCNLGFNELMYGDSKTCKSDRLFTPKVGKCAAAPEAHLKRRQHRGAGANYENSGTTARDATKFYDNCH